MAKTILCVIGGLLGAVGVFFIAKSLEWENQTMAKSKRKAERLEDVGVVLGFVGCCLLFIGATL